MCNIELMTDFDTSSHAAPASQQETESTGAWIRFWLLAVLAGIAALIFSIAALKFLAWDPVMDVYKALPGSDSSKTIPTMFAIVFFFGATLTMLCGLGYAVVEWAQQRPDWWRALVMPLFLLVGLAVISQIAGDMAADFAQMVLPT